MDQCMPKEFCLSLYVWHLDISKKAYYAGVCRPPRTCTQQCSVSNWRRKIFYCRKTQFDETRVSTLKLYLRYVHCTFSVDQFVIGYTAGYSVNHNTFLGLGIQTNSRGCCVIFLTDNTEVYTRANPILWQ